MTPSSSFTQHYLDYYTPLVQEFVHEVEKLPHPEAATLPAPFLPLFGKAYDTSKPRLVVLGQDTLGWGDLKDFLRDPGRQIQNRLDEFWKNPEPGPVRTRNQFGGFTKMLLAALHGQEQWKTMNNEVLDSFAWGNCNAVELRKSSTLVPNDYWAAVRKAGARFDHFKHIVETLNPRAAIVLCSGMHPESYFEGYMHEEVAHNDSLVHHYRLPEIDVDVFQAPHPGYMNRLKKVDYFCAELKALCFQNNVLSSSPN